MSEPSTTSVVPYPSLCSSRDVDTVPYVEMFGNRLQGVVSSGSDVERVYCAFIEAGSGDYYSSTNNNRPDAGMAKRLNWLTDEAVAQFGVERVARFLKFDLDTKLMTGSLLATAALRRGSRRAEPANTVFSRFLNYLRHVELRSAAGPVPEMSWFVGP